MASCTKSILKAGVAIMLWVPATSAFAMQDVGPAADPSRAPSQTAGTERGTSANPQPSAAAGANQYENADIVVTAQKREQKLNDVGLTITAVTGASLQQRQVTSLQDIANAVPGLTYTKTITGAPVFTLRGVGFYDTALAAYPTTSVYMDEVGLPFGALTAHGAFDLDHIEVLKGPQGTLFGQNSTGGAINYIAAKPTRRFEAGAEVSYGRFNQVNAEGYISGPITDTLSARIAGRLEHMDGWQISNSRPNDRNGKVKTYMGRAIVDFQPSDGVKFSLNANGWIDRGQTQAPQYVGVFVQKEGFLPDSIADSPYSPLRARAADWTPGLPSSHNSFWQVSLRGDVDLFDDVVMTSITSYTHYDQEQSVDNDGLPTSNQDVVNDTGRIKSFAQEVRFSNGSGSRLRWVAGANYSHDNVVETIFNDSHDSSVYNQLLPLGYAVANSVPTSKQRMRNIAGFANSEFDLTDKLTLKAGGRYTDAKRTADECLVDPQIVTNGYGPFFYDVLYGGAFGPYQAGDCFSGNFTLPGATPQPIGGVAVGAPGRYIDTLHEHNFSWRAGADYKLTRDVLFYANVSKGYKAGSYPIQPAANVAQYQPVKQESVLAYEAGFKASLLDHALQFNAAGFYYDYRNKQLRTRYNDPVFGVLDILANIPKSSIRGFEIEATVNPTRGLTVSTAFTWLDGSIDKYVGDDTEDGPAALGTKKSFAGSPIPYTPKYQISTNVDYKFDIGDRLRGFVGANLNMRSSSIASIGGRNPVGAVAEVPLIYRIDSYATLDGQIGVDTADGRYRFMLWAKNLTNSYYFNNSIIAYDTIARFAAMPRTFGFSARARFR